MKIDVLKNTKRNVFWGVINKFIIIFAQLLIRTVIIQTLGAQYLGLNGLFTSILQVLSLTELGFENAIIFSMYKPIAEDDETAICALLNFYRKVYFIVAGIILCIGLSIIPFLHLLIKQDGSNIINIYLLYLVYLINTVISYSLFAYKTSLLKAHQRGDEDSKIQSSVNIIICLFQIVLLLIFKNYFIFIIFLPISTILINIIRSIKVKKMYPKYFAKGKIQGIEIENIKKNVAGVFLYKVCGIFRNSFDSIIISSFLGLVILAQYQNYYYVMFAVLSFVGILTTSIIPGIGNNIKTKSVEDNYSEFKVWAFLYNWISSWCTVCLVCLYQPFMKIWVGEKYLFSYGAVILFSLYFYCLKVGDITAVYREASGIWWKDKYRPIIDAVANLTINILLVRYWGIFGVLISTIICIILISVPWAAYILFHNYFNKSVKMFYKLMVKNLLIVIIVSIVTYLLCSSLKQKGVIELLLRIVIVLICPNVLFGVLFYKNPEFNKSINLVRKIIKKK